MSTASETNTLTMTQATPKELSYVIMLAHRIWPTAYQGILTDEQIQNMLRLIYSHESLRQEVQDGHQFWLAYHGPKPVAYASVFREGDIIWLKKLYVEPDLKGRKIGTRLMHKAVSSLLPAVEIRLLANPQNVPAHGFYQRLGFSKIGEVPVRMGDYSFNDFLFSMPLITK